MTDQEAAIRKIEEKIRLEKSNSGRRIYQLQSEIEAIETEIEEGEKAEKLEDLLANHPEIQQVIDLFEITIFGKINFHEHLIHSWSIGCRHPWSMDSGEICFVFIPSLNKWLKKEWFKPNVEISFEDMIKEMEATTEEVQKYNKEFKESLDRVRVRAFK